jgi:PP-loop superfamily ATP-utilizing enzyme
VICASMNSCSGHAEMNVLKKLDALKLKHKIKMHRLELVVVRILFNECNEMVFKMSKPCMHCTQILHNTLMRHISWSTDDGTFETCRPCDLTSDHISRRYRLSQSKYE